MGLFDKLKSGFSRYDDEYDDEMGQQDEYEEQDDGYDDRFESFSQPAPAGSDLRSGRVVNIQTAAQLQVMLVEPTEFDEVKEIAQQLNRKITVVLNLENCAPDVSRRILDFLSGAIFANHGVIKPVAKLTFILTPSNVTLMGNLLNDLEGNGFSIGR